MVYQPKTAKSSPSAQTPSTGKSTATLPGQAGAKVTGKSPQVTAQAIADVQARQRAADPNDPGVQAQAKQLHHLITQLTDQEQTTGSPATAVVGVENAANFRLGSSRQLAKDGGFWKGITYPSLDEDVQELKLALNKLKAAGNLATVMQAYEKLYGTTLTAVLGERVRNPQARSQLMNVLPPPISEAQLTKDAFIEQLSVQYVYMNDPASILNARTDDGRRGSNPKDILGTFGYKAGPPIAGKWGFQMRVFLPVDAKAGKPPIVAFRGTEGISFSMSKKPEGTLDTVIGDFSPAGVGYNQYQQNHALILRNMQALTKYGKVIITGHSLGGALAQIAATEFRAMTSEVVTFQAAGVSEQDVNKMKAYNAANPKDAVKSRHYRIDGDVVPNAGQGFLPGEINYFDRMVRQKGETNYQMELMGDAVDPTRAQGGHVTPMLSTYLRGQKPQNDDQKKLASKGLHDETAMQGADVQMVYGGKYTTEKDPRIQLESRRTTTMVKAMNISSMYDSVYYDQISYNTLLAKVEEMAASKQFKDYLNFRDAARDLIVSLRGKGTLPIKGQDQDLAKQLRISMEEYQTNGLLIEKAPSQYANMVKSGVPITIQAADRVNLELERIWDSWHPEIGK